jgi:phosphoribosylformylglycinamidine synthase
MLETEIRVTPEIVAEHGLSAEEYARIQEILGREPNITELGIFCVMWSEHCSYKSSKVHLKRLPTCGPQVLQGPGENAGVVEIGDGLCAVFKIESHNHPSFVEPFQGAATGVGGILRDIFTMGARPIAVLDALRFGPIAGEVVGAQPAAPASGAKAPEEKQGKQSEMSELKLRPPGEHALDAGTIARNRRILDGVIGGIAFYGNCFGVPTVGGDVLFEPCYSPNPLVNVLALGIAKKDQLFFARARGVGNPVIYVGAKTGRDGIHGASLLASAEFTEESQQKRPNVQVADPFMEKLLLEACLEAMRTGVVVGIQDMGAAGLTCSTCEMGSRGGTGIEIELAKVPQRETGMTPYEIMLSESQERMLLVAERGREHEVLKIFAKWGLDAVEIGQVTDDGMLRVRNHGKVVAEIPAHTLAEEGPVYNRPMKAPAPRMDERLVQFVEEGFVGARHAVPASGDVGAALGPPPGGAGSAPTPASGAEAPEKGTGSLSELKLRPSINLTENFRRLLASPAIASKRWIFEQYDHMVRTNTMVVPGAGDAAVMRVKGTRRALALAVDGNGRWCWLDPRVGAMHAVAEAARNVACSGARPFAATNCLNFGNPEKPEVLWQFSQVIDGMAEACGALGVPITGGNVSFYNETLGKSVYPTPVIGVLGLLEDSSRALGMGFRTEGDVVVLLDGRGAVATPGAGSNVEILRPRQTLSGPQDDTWNGLAREFSSSEYAKAICGVVAGAPPAIDLAAEKRLIGALVALAAEGVLHSAHDVSDGGLAVTIAESCFASVGAYGRTPLQPMLSAQVTLEGGEPLEAVLFGERGARAVVSAAPESLVRIEEIARQYGVAARASGRVTRSDFRIQFNGRNVVVVGADSLRETWANALERTLKNKV